MSTLEALLRNVDVILKAMGAYKRLQRTPTLVARQRNPPKLKTTFAYRPIDAMDDAEMSSLPKRGILHRDKLGLGSGGQTTCWDCSPRQQGRLG